MSNELKHLLSLAPSTRRRLESLAEAEGLSMEDLFMLAAAEKLARYDHAQWLSKQQLAATAASPERDSVIEKAKHFDENAFAVNRAARSLAGTFNWRPDEEALSFLSSEQEAEELNQLAALFRAAPVFIAVLGGPEHVFESVNGPYRKLLGDRDFIGKRVVDVIPEVAGTVWMQRLDRVYQSGILRVERGARLSIAPEPGKPLEDKYVDYAYKPRREADGTVSGIVALGMDTSLIQQVFQNSSGGAFLLNDSGIAVG